MHTGTIHIFTSAAETGIYDIPVNSFIIFDDGSGFPLHVSKKSQGTLTPTSTFQDFLDDDTASTASLSHKTESGIYVVKTTDNFITTLNDTFEKLTITNSTLEVNKPNGHFTWVNNAFNIQTDGVYRLKMSGSANWGFGEAMLFTVYKNGVNLNLDGNAIFEGRLGSLSVFIYAEATHEFVAGDVIEIYFKTETAQTITTDFAKFSIEKLSL